MIGIEINHILWTSDKWVFKDKYRTIIHTSNPTFRCITKELKMEGQTNFCAHIVQIVVHCEVKDHLRLLHEK